MMRIHSLAILCWLALASCSIVVVTASTVDKKDFVPETLVQEPPLNRNLAKGAKLSKKAKKQAKKQQDQATSRGKKKKKLYTALCQDNADCSSSNSLCVFCGDTGVCVSKLYDDNEYCGVYCQDIGFGCSFHYDEGSEESNACFLWEDQCINSSCGCARSS